MSQRQEAMRLFTPTRVKTKLAELGSSESKFQFNYFQFHSINFIFICIISNLFFFKSIVFIQILNQFQERRAIQGGIRGVLQYIQIVTVSFIYQFQS
jgi:hypothetical protein